MAEALTESATLASSQSLCKFGFRKRLAGRTRKRELLSTGISTDFVSYSKFSVRDSICSVSFTDSEVKYGLLIVGFLECAAEVEKS